MAPVNEAFWEDGDRRKGATQREIAFAEAYIGWSLPVALCRLLLLQNGGVSTYSGYCSNDGVYYSMLPVLGVGHKTAYGTIMAAVDVGESFGVPAGVVPIAADGESWFGLDYRADSDAPAVVYRHDWDHELETVASSFDAFLEGLTTFEEAFPEG